MRPSLGEIKYGIADTFFSRELDEAFEMGIREGSRRALGAAKVRIEYRTSGLTPARKSGMELALEIIEEEKSVWNLR